MIPRTHLFNLRASVSLFAFLLALAAALPTAAMAAESSRPAAYPLDVCIVSDEPLGAPGDAVVKDYDGREVRFCCKRCVKDFEKDKATYHQKLDAAIMASQSPDYPMTSCPVSGEELGSMGAPVNHIVGNRLIRLCCSSCNKELTAEPTAFVSKLDAAAVSAQLADYPADTCPISGQKLGSMGDPYNYVFAGRLVRFCCAGCIGQFDVSPVHAMQTVYGEAAPIETKESGHEHDHSGHDHSGHDHDDQSGHDHSGHDH